MTGPCLVLVGSGSNARTTLVKLYSSRSPQRNMWSAMGSPRRMACGSGMTTSEKSRGSCSWCSFNQVCMRTLLKLGRLCN